MGLRYPPRIPLAQTPTPLQPLPRLSDSHGGGHRLWVKRDDLTGADLSGNKVRKLEFVTAAARERGCDTLITCGGVQSNHCRATALVGARLGLRVHLILRDDRGSDGGGGVRGSAGNNLQGGARDDAMGDRRGNAQGDVRGNPRGNVQGAAPATSDGNLLLGQLAGAAVSLYSRAEYTARLDALFAHWQAHYERDGSGAFCIPTGASDGLGLWGYIAASEELGQDLQREGVGPAHVVCATGSGGTQAGLTLGAALHGLDLAVWGVNVCDDAAWFRNKVAADIADWERRVGRAAPPVQARVIDGYVGPGYGRAGPEVFDTIRLVARQEGLVLDPVYTGKAFHGMLEQIAAGRFAGRQDIVFLHTGGIFGLFPQRRQMLGGTPATAPLRH